MRTKHAVMAAAVLAVMQLGAPGAAQAQSTLYDNTICTATTLNVCLGFDLTYDSGTNTYTLLSRYLSSTAPTGQQGYITSLGIYDMNSSSPFDIAVTSIAVSNGGTWCSPDIPLSSGNCNVQDLSGNGSMTLLGGAESKTTGISGLQVGDFATITFTSLPQLSAADFSSEGSVGLRAHVQSFGPNGCSMKPDTRATGNVFSVGSDCFSTVTPEPMSTALLATGLLGLAGVALKRRMSGDGDVENA